MKPFVKASFVTALFLVPLWFVCSRPIAIQSELMPLPFKARERPQPSLTLDGLQETKAVFIGLPDSGDASPANVLRHSEPDMQTMKKFSFNYGAIEVQDRDAVRLKGAKVGVDYHVDAQQSVGVEGSQQLYDRQDAEAWGKDAKDESAAGIKYKLIF